MALTKVPYPRRYWGYIGLIAVLFLGALGCILGAAALTGWKDDLDDRELMIVLGGIAAAAGLIALAFPVASRAGRLAIARFEAEAGAMDALFAQHAYDGLQAEEYDRVWLWPEEWMRATAKEQDGRHLTVADFDPSAEMWTSHAFSTVFEDLETLKAALYEEYELVVKDG